VDRVDADNRQMLVVYAAVVLAVALIGARYLSSLRAERGPEGAAQVSLTTAATGVSGGAGDGGVVVYVSGAVRRPGIVRLHDGDRVADALKAARGALRSADLNAVNLAARVVDGQQVVVPRRGGGGGASGGGGATISLSSATAEELQTLDGIGPGLAKKILDYRAQHGFRSVDELGEVPGIGEKRLDALRGQLQP
jgi:competence protein ComEA